MICYSCYVQLLKGLEEGFNAHALKYDNLTSYRGQCIINHIALSSADVRRCLCAIQRAMSTLYTDFARGALKSVQYISAIHQ